MPELQDVFWSGFADEVEKLAGVGKGLLAAGAVGGAAALAAAGGKGTDGGLKEKTTGAKSAFGRTKAQMAAAE